MGFRAHFNAGADFIHNQRSNEPHFGRGYKSLLRLILCFWLGVHCVGRAEDAVNYQDHIKQIFQYNCAKCHNADKAKGGLDLTSMGSIMQGGSSGAVVNAGNPDNSLLYLAMAHKREPFMPKDSPVRPAEELETIRRWIAGGLIERAGGAAQQAKPKVDLKLSNVTTARPAGPPPMPRGLLLEPLPRTAHVDAAAVLAASPWAPLVAVGGQQQVFLYHAESLQLLGVLPFPEGLPRTLKFSRNGRLLLCGGGTPGRSGRVVVWDVTTGERVIEVGEEFDTVLAADISADQSLVALGGPDKKVKVFATATGERIQLHKKHTDWVTAIEYSPDGVLLASGDRNGGLVVWEAQSGQEFYVLSGHQAAITSLSWRKDGNVLASASEDGTVRLWNANDGRELINWRAHETGVLSVDFARDGRLVTTGRDKLTRVWDGNGKQLAEIKDFKDIVLKAIFADEDHRIVIGDWTGAIRVVSSDKCEPVGALDANPPPLAERIETTLGHIPALEKKLVLCSDAAAKAPAADPQKAAAAAADKVATERELEAVRADADRLKAAQLDQLLNRVRQKLKEQGQPPAANLTGLTDAAAQAIDRLQFPRPSKPAATQPESAPNPIFQFLGRFHIVLLHLPIGILLLAAFLELYGLVRPNERAPQAAGLVLRLGAVAAVTTAVCGWLLAESGHYEAGPLTLHRWLGIAASAGAVLAALMRRRRLMYYPVLLATIGCLIAAAHLGGTLTHGEGFLTRYLPDVMAKLTGKEPATADLLSEFAAVKPILETRCYGCHGAAKQESAFRLDVKALAFKGGKTGRPAIVPGAALESELVRRITLPHSDRDAMPPEGKPALSPAEIMALIDWINTGAKWPNPKL
jgi:mono/diheme cytochrome c family protein